MRVRDRVRLRLRDRVRDRVRLRDRDRVRGAGCGARPTLLGKGWS